MLCRHAAAFGFDMQRLAGGGERCGENEDTDAEQHEDAMLTPPRSGNNARGLLAVRAWGWVALAASLGGCTAPSPYGAYPFDAGEFLAAPAQWPAWGDMLARHAQQRPAVEACIADQQACSRRMRSFAFIVGESASLPRQQQIQLVNRFINRRGYDADRRRTLELAEGKVVRRSHWATLKEFLEQGGDCEDFAAAKYFILRRLGFPAAALRIVVVYDRRYREHHAVVAVRQADGTAWVLETDNFVFRERKPMDFRYVYAVNEHGIWDHGVTAQRR